MISSTRYASHAKETVWISNVKAQQASVPKLTKALTVKLWQFGQAHHIKTSYIT